MAFSTQFVASAGGTVEEIAVSNSGNGFGNSLPLTTVNAGTGAWVWVDGSKNGSAFDLVVAQKKYEIKSASSRAGGGGHFTGSVAVSMVTQSGSTATFSGTVYVIRI